MNIVVESLRAPSEIRMVYEDQLFNGKKTFMSLFIIKQKVSADCINMIIMNSPLF
ncbi:hypothetical protein PROPEN_01368 [Proteus penneri ATCC 35198]|nr:hypothetical protein PROPEN_01368 [Proteus penneri ATCC 35198]